jgi:hypothetical protein
MTMDAALIEERLKSFIRQHRVQFDSLGKREAQLLELGALVLAARHYELAGYKISPLGISNDLFRVKLIAQGRPWNYSWFAVTKGVRHFEIHSNLSVYSAYGRDGGVYVVDVAVVKPEKLPRSRQATWRALKNDDLITIMEAKRIAVYPMLLAQFVGIVHEIMPNFLRAGRRPYRFVADGHFVPTLISIGSFSGTSRSIVNAYQSRKFYLKIVANADIELAKLRSGYSQASPLA